MMSKSKEKRVKKGKKEEGGSTINHLKELKYKGKIHLTGAKKKGINPFLLC